MELALVCGRRVRAFFSLSLESDDEETQVKTHEHHIAQKHPNQTTSTLHID